MRSFKDIFESQELADITHEILTHHRLERVHSRDPQSREYIGDVPDPDAIKADAQSIGWRHYASDEFSGTHYFAHGENASHLVMTHRQSGPGTHVMRAMVKPAPQTMAEDSNLSRSI